MLASLPPLHHFCCVINMVFVEGAKCVSLHTQFLDHPGCTNRTLHFCILLSMNTLCVQVFSANAYDLEHTVLLPFRPFSWLAVYLILSPEGRTIRSGLSSSVMCDTQQTFNHWLARWIIQTAGSVAGTMTNTHPHTCTYNALLPTHVNGPHLRSFQRDQVHVHFAYVIFTVAPSAQFVACTFVYFP